MQKALDKPRIRPTDEKVGNRDIVHRARNVIQLLAEHIHMEQRKTKS